MTVAAVRRVLKRCPAMYAEEIADRLRDRPCDTASIVEMARAVIRHQLTDYDNLISRHQLTREEARDAVAAEIEEWLEAWRADKPG